MGSTLAKRLLPFLAVAAICVSACGSEGKAVSESTGENNTGQSSQTSGTEDGGEEGDTTTREEAEETTTTAAPDKPDVEVTETGFSLYAAYDDSQRATAGAILTNKGGQEATFIEVVFSFKDAAGKPVATESSYVYAIDPGGVGYAEVSGVEGAAEAATVDVAAIVEEDSFWDGFVVPLVVEGVAPEDYGDGVEVKGIAENPSEEVLESVTVTCILRSGGKIVGGASGYLDTLVPGGSIAWDATGPVPAESAECAGSKYD